MAHAHEVHKQLKERKVLRSIRIKITIACAICITSIVLFSATYVPTLKAHILHGYASEVHFEHWLVYILIFAQLWATEHGADLLVLEDEHVPPWYNVPITWLTLIGMLILFQEGDIPYVLQVREYVQNVHLSPVTIVLIFVIFCMVCWHSSRRKQRKQLRRDIDLFKSRIVLLQDQYIKQSSVYYECFLQKDFDKELANATSSELRELREEIDCNNKKLTKLLEKYP